MKLDAMMLGSELSGMADYAKLTEEIGFDGLWTTETSNDPFFPLVLAAEHTSRMNLGTSIAVTFPRAPGVLAQIGWDLAKFSNGRFIMGLGSQVRAHNERRFGAKWDKPVRQMRESIEATRAIWHSYQTGEPLKYEGEYFNLSLMTPFFNGGPIDYPKVPIFVSAVNKLMLRLSGSHCEGVHLHAINTIRYLKEYAWPHIEAGMAKTGRKREGFQPSAGVFVLPTDAKERAKIEAFVREQISFYLSTPAYRIVAEIHGWEEEVFQLSKLARSGGWKEMPALITDEMMAEFVVTGTWAELPAKLHTKYDGLLERVSYYLPYEPGADDEGWKSTIDGFKKFQ